MHLEGQFPVRMRLRIDVEAKLFGSQQRCYFLVSGLTVDVS